MEGSEVVNVDPEVHEAVLLRHAHLNPDRREEITSEEYRTLLADVLARKAAIENEAVQIVNSKLKEERRIPRRHTRFALALVALIIIVACGLFYLSSLW